MPHRSLARGIAFALVALLVAAGAGACSSASTGTSSSATPAGSLSADETAYLNDLAASETQTAHSLQSLAKLGDLPLSQSDKAKLTAADAQLVSALSTWSKRQVPSQRLQGIHKLWLAALQGYFNGVDKIRQMAASGTKSTANLKSALKQIAKGQVAMKSMLKELDKLASSFTPSPPATP